MRSCVKRLYVCVRAKRLSMRRIIATEIHASSLQGSTSSVLGQPAPGGQPRQRPFHHPPPFEDMKPLGPDLRPLNVRSLRGPDAAQPAPGMLHDLDLPTQLRFDPLDEVAFL